MPTGPFNTISGATASTYDPPAGVVTTTFYRRRVTSGVCTTDGPDADSDPDNIAYSNVITVTVNQVVDAGTISAAQTICSGQDPAILTSVTPASGGDGTTYAYQWQQASVLAGPYSNIAGQTGLTFDPPVLTSTTVYRRQASSGVCSATTSNVIQITVNPLPTASNPSPASGSVCLGSPAPDITWTLTGTPPFNITVTRSVEGPLVVNGHPSNTFTLSAPLPPATQTYQITSLTDANSCFGTSLGGLSTVTVTATPPPTVDAFTATAAVCDDGGGTNPPDAVLDLAPNSVQPYSVSYRLLRISTGVTGAIIGPATFNSDASGVITIAPTYAQMGNAPDTQGYQVIITSIVNTATGCSGSVPIDGPILIVNPRPAVPTGAVGAIACSSALSGATVSVDPPLGGFTIAWSTTAAPTFTAAAGVTGGTRGNQFTPTSNATVTYHAFTQNDVTLCRSATSLPVQHTQDVTPTVAAAGPAQQNCTGTFTLAGNTPNTAGGEIGTWSIPGIAYLQNFSAYANGTATSAALNGWTIDTSAPGTFAGGQGSFNVQSNRFEATNLDGSGTGGAEVVWRSPVITGTFPSLNISVNLSSTAMGGASDYLRVFYRLNGGAEVALTNGNQNGTITGTVAATATGLNVTSSIQLVFRVNNNAAGETYRFDDIVMANAGAPTIPNPNSNTATVTNLPVGVNTLTWTISSRFGVCPSSSSNVLLERFSLPTPTPLTRTLCEEVFGGGSQSNFDLTTLNSAATGGDPLLTVEWFFPGPPPAGAITPANTPQTITNGKVYHYRLTNTVTGCQSNGTVTFTVNPLPVANNQTFNFCENFVGANQASPINLQSFENAITGGAANREVDWFEDAALTVPIPPASETTYSTATTKTIYARVTNTLTSCTRPADVILNLRLRPQDNPITGNSVACTDPSNIVLYQVNPTLNAGSSFTWTVTGTPPGAVQLFGGGGTNSPNFFVLLKFPATGTVNLTMQETLNGCTGNVQNFAINVSTAPSSPAITGPTAVCTNETGITYSVPSNVTSVFTWTVTGATIVGPSSGPNLNTITVDYGLVTPVTVRVTETSSSGCAAPPAQTIVNLSTRPIMTSATSVTACSGNAPSLNFTASQPSSFAWRVVSITGAIGGTAVNNTGTGNLTEVLTNTTGAIGSVTYEVTPTATAAPGCVGVVQNVTVTVSPEPVLLPDQVKTICSGEAVNYQVLLSPLNLPAGTTFSWPVPVMSDASAQGSSGTNVPATNPLHLLDVLTNTTANPISATYTITPSVSGCTAGAPRTVVITVNPSPRISTLLNATKCSTEPIGLNLELQPGSVSASGYNFLSRSVSSGLTPGPTNAVIPSAGAVAANYLINDTYKNVGNGNSVLTVTYRVEAVGSIGSCKSTPLDIVISINPEPLMSTSLDATVCSGANIGVLLTTAPSSASATSFNVIGVTIPAGLTPGGTNAVVPTVLPQPGNYLQNDRFTNVTGGALTVSYQVEPVGTLGAGCPGSPPKTINVTILPSPVINSVTSVTVCSGQSVGPFNFTANSGGGENFTWTNDNPAIGLGTTGTGNIPAFAVSANLTGSNQVASVTVNAAKGGCTSSTPLVFQIVVRPQPVITPVADITVCPGQTINAINFTANTGGGETFAWTNDNTTIGLAGAGTGAISSYAAPENLTGSDIIGNLSVTATLNGCVSNAMLFRITIKPQPVLTAVASMAKCPTELVGPFNFTANTGGGETITWTNDNAAVGIPLSGSGSIASYTAPTNLSGAPFVGNISVTATKNGCTSAVRTFTVTIKPQPVISPVANITLCPGQTVGPVNFSANTGGGETFNWTNSNIAIGLAASGSGNIGSYLAPLNGSGSPIVGNVSVTGTLNSCVSSPVTFNIAVNPTPVVTPLADIVRCPGASIPAVNFSANSGGGEVFNWTNSNTNIGLPANGTGNIATFLAPPNLTGVAFIGTISVTATKGGCTSSAATFQIRIDPQPVINPIANVAVCPGQSIGPINFTANTGGGETFTWTNSNTAIGLAGSGTGSIATYIAPANTTGSAFVGTVTVTATRNGCVSSVQNFTISVNPQPIVTTMTNVLVCPGQTIGPLNFSSNAGGGETFTWTNSNTAIGLAGSGTGNIPSWTAPANTSGVAFVGTISVIATRNGCASGPMNFQVTVNPQPVVATQTDLVACPGATIGPLNFVANTGGSETINWTNSNTAIGLVSSGTGNIPTFVAGSNVTGADRVGTISVTATKNGCTSAPMNFTVTVRPNPVVAAVPNVVVCPGQSIAAINFSANSGGSETFAWTNSNTAIGLAASGSGTIASFTAAANATGADIVGTVSVTGSKNGCTGAATTFTITIRPQPVVNSVADVSVCAGQSVAAIPFTANTGGGETFAWTNSNTSIGLAASGTGNIPAFTAPANLTGSDFVGTISVTATRNGCVSAPRVFTISVRAQPVVAAVANVAACSGPTAAPITIGPINFSANTGGGETFAWTNTNTLIGLPLSGTGNIAAYTSPANTTNANYVGTISLTATKNGCSSAPAVTFTITVRPRPEVSTTLNKTVCSNTPFAQTLNTDGVSIAASTYNVTAVKDPGLVGTPVTGNNLPANALNGDTFINTTAVPLTVLYTITPNGTNGCIGDPRVVTLTVNPEPVLINPGVPAVCSGANSDITLATNGTSVGAANYQLVNKLYSTDGGTTFTAVAPSNFSDVGNVALNTTGSNVLVRTDKFVNTRSGQVIVRYQIRPISVGLCNGAPVNFDLPVNPQPTLDPTLNPTPVCSGVAANVTLAVAPGSVAAATYNINSLTFAPLVRDPANSVSGTGQAANAIFNDKYVNTPAVNPSGTPLPAVYKIAPVSAAGCIGAEGTVTLTINPSPALASGLDRTVCSSEASGVTLATQGTVTAASYNIISATLGAGLTQTAGNTGARTGVGQNEIVNDRFQNLTTGVRTVVYRIEPVSSSACRGPQVDITLTVEPAVTMLTPSPASLCSDTPATPAQTNIALNSTVVPSAGNVTFDYTAVAVPAGSVSGFLPVQSNLPSGFVIADKLVNNANAVATVTYTITPKALGAKGGAGCSATAPTVVTVTVEPKPKMSVTPASQAVCEGVATSLVLNSATAPSAGDVRFEVTNVVATGGVTGFTPVATLITPGSTLADVLNNPTVTDQTVTYTLLPRIVGGPGCVGDPLVVSVTVKPRPTVTAASPAPICSGDIIDIDLNPDIDNTICTWTVSAPGITGASAGSGNKIIQTLFNNTFAPATATYTVIPKLNGCDGATITINVVVNPKPDIVGLPSTLNVCEGAALNVPLNGNVAGTTYAWTVTDPSVLGVPLTGSGNTININPILNTTGSQAPLTFSITPSANGCVGNLSVLLVNVAPRMGARFLSSNASICLGSSEFLIVQLDGQAPFTLVYSQNDGTTSTDITLTNVGNVRVIQVTPPTTGTYTYTLKSVTDAFNCPLTISTPAPNQISTVNVGDTNSNFTVLTPTPVCGPRTFEFQYNQVAGVQYTWQWFDGSPDSVYVATVTQPNTVVRHRFANPAPVGNITYNVTLRTQLSAPFPGCFKSTIRPITIFPSMVINVFPNRTEICGNEQVQLFNQSQGVVSHRWFWRLQGSSVENDVRTTATVIYTLTNTTSMTPLVYEIVYQANNGSCPTPDVVTPVTVHRSVVADFTVPAPLPQFTGAPVSVLFTNNSNPNNPAVRYEWNFGLDSNPLNFTGQTPPAVLYSSPGFRTITLRVINTLAETAGLTCADTETKTINILIPPLTAEFEAGPPAACSPATISVTQSTLGGNKNTWEIVDQLGNVAGRQFNVNTPSFVVSNPGEYTIILKVENTLTNQDLTVQRGPFRVIENPVASFQARPTTVFVPDDELTTFNFSTGATGYEWNFGDGGTSFLAEPKYTYQVEGVYELSLTALRDQAGVTCRDVATQTITAKQGGVTKIPNAFTPNPNGPTGGSQPGGGTGAVNDVFLPIVKGSLEFNLQVFDRWGNLTFESNNSSIGWDGYDQNGRLMPSGVYVYKLTVRLSNDQRTTQIGDVTLIR